MQLIIISGLSGSGKSVALNVLADSDFYCVDNLPAELLIATVDFLRQGGTTKAAVTIDARTGESLTRLPQSVATLKDSGVDVRLVFLDARQDSLLRRFSETRRRHPLAAGETTIEECIDRERELLAPIAELGQRIDTSDLNPNALRQWMKDLLQLGQSGMTLVFESFGFKQGIPLDADFVFDVRFLPNPNYIPEFKPLTGKHPSVARYIRSFPQTQEFLSRVTEMLAYLLPHYIKEGKSYLTIGFGCTGGQHRSVMIAEEVAKRLKRTGFPIKVHHRDALSKSGKKRG